MISVLWADLYGKFFPPIKVLLYQKITKAHQKRYFSSMRKKNDKVTISSGTKLYIPAKLLSIIIKYVLKLNTKFNIFKMNNNNVWVEYCEVLWIIKVLALSKNKRANIINGIVDFFSSYFSYSVHCGKSQYKSCFYNKNYLSVLQCVVYGQINHDLLVNNNNNGTYL